MESPAPEEIIQTLPTKKGISFLGSNLHEYQGFWYDPPYIKAILSLEQNFKPQDTHIILCSPPKAGTTWLKALAFSITVRSRFDVSQSTSPLLTKLPHACVPQMEFDVFHDRTNPETDVLDVPQLFGTHIAFNSLPKSVIDAGCKIVYICRDPKDAFVSLWHFINKWLPKGVVPLSVEEAFEFFCDGVVSFGPFWDHVLGYWRASLAQPERCFFLKYEEVKRNPEVQVKRLAEFMGYPFSIEEQQNEVVEKIIDMCSFERLSNLDVNKNGMHHEGSAVEIQNKLFFRKGGVGDWKNHLTPEMAARMDFITEQKFSGSGLNLTSLHVRQ